MLKHYSRKVGRPKEIAGIATTTCFSIDGAELSKFKELCSSVGITVAEGIRQAIHRELEEKNEVGTVNPLNINYADGNKLLTEISIPAIRPFKHREAKLLAKDIRSRGVARIPLLGNVTDFAQAWYNLDNKGDYYRFCIYSKTQHEETRPTYSTAPSIE